MVNLARIPKIEFHLHLGGTIRLPTLQVLINKYDPVLSKTLSQQTLNFKFQYKNFHYFLELWARKNTCLREPDDFTLILSGTQQQTSSPATRRTKTPFNEMFSQFETIDYIDITFY